MWTFKRKKLLFTCLSFGAYVDIALLKEFVVKKTKKQTHDEQTIWILKIFSCLTPLLIHSSQVFKNPPKKCWKISCPLMNTCKSTAVHNFLELQLEGKLAQKTYCSLRGLKALPFSVVRYIWAEKHHFIVAWKWNLTAVGKYNHIYWTWICYS